MITRDPHPKQYTAIPTPTLKDTRLTLEAQGLLTRILALPDSWEIRPRVLETEARVGREKIRRILKELELAGYLERRRIHGQDGQWVWSSTVYDVPQHHCQCSHRTAGPISVDREPTVSDGTIAQKPVDGQPMAQKPVDGQPIGRRPVDGSRLDISITDTATNELATKDTTTTSHPTTSDCGDGGDVDIVLPPVLHAQRSEAITALNVAPAAYRQQIADELAGAYAAGNVYNPLGWLRRVANTATANGRFCGDYSAKVRAARERKREAQRVRRSTRGEPPRASTKAAARKGLRHIKDALAGSTPEGLTPESAQDLDR